MTERLRLRRLRHGDAGSVAHFMGDWDVAKQTGELPYPYSEEAARDWIAREVRAAARGRGCALVIECRATGAFIGTLSLRARPRRILGTIGEIGYWIGKPYWGQGYASEALEAGLAWFDAVFTPRKIEAVTFADNAASVGVLKKLGFRFARAQKRDYPDRGGVRDVLLYRRAPERRITPRRARLRSGGGRPAHEGAPRSAP